MSGNYWGVNPTGLLCLPLFLVCTVLPLLFVGPIGNTVAMIFGTGKYYNEQGQPFERKSSWRTWAIFLLLCVIVLGVLGFVLPPS